MNASASECIAVLLRQLGAWASFADRYWWDSATPGEGCFGTGYNSWGVQTNQKYLGAMASLGTHPQAAEVVQEGVQVHARERALAALRFSLSSHKSGTGHCADGTQWGCTWISPLGVERMMHGVAALKAYLTDAENAAIARMLAMEADFQLGETIHAGLWGHEGHNKPESNIWNGAICYRAAMWIPGHEHRDAWIEKAHQYFINGISIACDADDQTVVDGQTIAARHIGANFFPHFGLDHHAYLNLGYMVICISNIAMLHYSLLQNGQPVPQTLYHHAADLWELIRRLLFTDGRLARIGGDTRIRYCYCQDYLLPSLIFAGDVLGDDEAFSLLPDAVRLLQMDQDKNQNGSYLGHRLGEMEKQNTYYYTRLESDKAVVASLALDWLSRLKLSIPQKDTPRYEAAVAGGWGESEQGGAFHRSATRLASWCWRGGKGKVQGLCLPPHQGDLAEWESNLLADVKWQGAGDDMNYSRNVLRHSFALFEGGFLTSGEVEEGVNTQLKEGWGVPRLGVRQTVFAALPDSHTCIVMEQLRLDNIRAYAEHCAGTTLRIPNDYFNGNVRHYHAAGGEQTLAATGMGEPVGLSSSWVNIENQIALIGVYGASSMVLRPSAAHPGDPYPSLWCDSLSWGYAEGPVPHEAGSLAVDCACVVLSSVDATETQRLANENRCAPVCMGGEAGACRAVRVRGQDGADYLLVHNFSTSACDINLLEITGEWRCLETGDLFSATADGGALSLSGQQACLLRREE